MKQTICRVPDIGNFSEVSVIEVLVKPGDTVHEDQSIITVESEKASMEIPSDRTGTVDRVLVRLGDAVSSGDPLLSFVSSTADASHSVEKTCFVISPIGEPETDTRRRADVVFKHIIEPVASLCGYKAVRADHISEPGMITSQVIQHIIDDPLVIADLTDRNPNVFYELALRHALRLPLVQIIRKGDQLPFDIAGTRTIHVDHQDLDSVDRAKKEMTAQIKHLEQNPKKLETPISVSLDLQSLRGSDNPEARSLADVMTSVTRIRGSVAEIRRSLAEDRMARDGQRRGGTKDLLTPRTYASLTQIRSIADSMHTDMEVNFLKDTKTQREQLRRLIGLIASILNGSAA